MTNYTIGGSGWPNRGDYRCYDAARAAWMKLGCSKAAGVNCVRDSSFQLGVALFAQTNVVLIQIARSFCLALKEVPVVQWGQIKRRSSCFV